MKLQSRLSTTSKLHRLEFGDAAFTGRGEGGRRVAVGVERKTVRDLITSMVSGRFSGHQLPGLLRSYDFVYLIVEGIYRITDGYMEEKWGSNWHRIGGVSYRAVIHFLNTLIVKDHIAVLRTSGIKETSELIQALHDWWNDKNYDGHRGDSFMHRNDLIGKAPLLQSMAYVLPGVGLDKSKSVCDHFGSVNAMVRASYEEWLKVPGIGKKLAKTLSEIFLGE